MAVSQNGWRVIPNTAAGRAKLAVVIDGKGHDVRVLAGDVETIARWHIQEYARRVETINPDWCWGHNDRFIGTSKTVKSNHASGTAWDLNAPLNPDGVPTSRVMTPRQIRECHELEAESGGVLRWGGDWERDPDAMHWEIQGTPVQAAVFARKIRTGEEEFEDMDQETFNRMLVIGLKAAAKVDPLATILARTGASTNKQEPELDRDIAAVKATVDQVLAKLNEEDPA